MSQQSDRNPDSAAHAKQRGEAADAIRMEERPEALGPERSGGSGSLVWGGLAVLAGLVLVYLVFSGGGAPQLIEQQSPAVGRTLSRLQLAPLTGVDEPLELADLANKKAVLINFWGPWCHWCLVEMPDLLELRESLKNEDEFEFLFVSSAGGGGSEDVDALRADTASTLSQYPAPPATYHDPDAISRVAVAQAAQGQSFGYPTTILIDGQGVIHGYWAGYSPEAASEMRAAVEELLGEVNRRD